MPIHRIATLALFAAYLVLGWLIVDDYGITYDEYVQRRHGHVTVQYVADRFGIDHPPMATDGRSFSEYGMIFQIAATLIEVQQGAIDNPYRYYRVRHVLGFLLNALALLFFYRTLRLRWPDRRWYPLLGTALLLLSPRTFAHAFFNPKDHILLVFYVVATFTLVRFLNRRTYGALAWHILASALALNTRFPALAIVGATTGVLLWEQLIHRPGDVRRWWQLALYLPGTFLLMLPFFPYLWIDTGSRFLSTIASMSAYKWDSTVLLFGDTLLGQDLPAYYIPAWIVITVPLVYLLFLFTGLGYVVIGCFRKLRKGRLWTTYSEQLDFVHLGLGVGPIITVIVLGSTLYNGWRHLHFVYPALVFLAITGFEWARRRQPQVAVVAIIGSLLFTAFDMVRMHPVQQTYFNVLIQGENALKRFEMDYWGAGYREALVRLAEQVPAGEVHGVRCQNWICEENIRALPPDAATRLVIEKDWGKANYVATNFFWPQEKIDVLDRVPTDKGWIARREIIFKDRSWHYECLRDLEARQQVDKSSMGFVPVGSVDKVWLEKRSADDRDSHEAKYRRLLAQARQQDLFTVDQQTVRFLEFQPWRVRVAWHCRRLDGPDACPGHTAAVLDWGLGELGRREGWDKARDKMEALGDLGEYDLAFFCGNFKAYPNRFGVVGVWYPKRRDTARWEAAQAQGSLF